MAVIDVSIEPNGRTRVLFDCRKPKPKTDDEVLIAHAIARSLAAAGAEAQSSASE